MVIPGPTDKWYDMVNYVMRGESALELGKRFLSLKDNFTIIIK